MHNRSKLWATLLLVAVFTAGATFGGALSSAWGEGKSVQSESRDGNRGSQRRGRQSYADRLQTLLDLSPAQRDAIDSVLERRHQEVHRLWDEYSPRYDTLRQQARQQILTVLDEDQQATYRELLVKSDRRRSGDREGGNNGKDDTGEKRK